MPVESNTLPKRVDKAFKKTYPTATIQSVDSLTWPPSGEEHFRITFTLNGELMQSEYRQGGKEIRDSLRQLPIDEKTLEDSGDGNETKDNWECKMRVKIMPDVEWQYDAHEAAGCAFFEVTIIPAARWSSALSANEL